MFVFQSTSFNVFVIFSFQTSYVAFRHEECYPNSGYSHTLLNNLYFIECNKENSPNNRMQFELRKQTGCVYRHTQGKPYSCTIFLSHITRALTEA